jgi:hypothetical protein
LVISISLNSYRLITSLTDHYFILLELLILFNLKSQQVKPPPPTKRWKLSLEHIVANLVRNSLCIFFLRCPINYCRKDSTSYPTQSL